MSSAEYDGYQPEHPELIPLGFDDAKERLDALGSGALSMTPRETFLRAWWALSWLNPSLHPDDHEEWENQGWRQIAVEAFRRSDAGELDDGELYPAEASHNRVWIGSSVFTPTQIL